MGTNASKQAHDADDYWSTKTDLKPQFAQDNRSPKEGGQFIPYEQMGFIQEIKIKSHPRLHEREKQAI